MRRLQPRSFALLLLGVALSVPGPAGARPQLSTSLQLGALRSDAAPPSAERGWGFSSGLRGELLLGRQGSRDLGYGPYLEYRDLGFLAPALGGGGALLLPVLSTFPLTLSAGSHATLRDGALRPGLEVGAAWGVRDYNYHSNYAPQGGLLLQLRRDLGRGPASSVHLEAQLDLALLGLPLLIAWKAVSGPSRQAAPLDPPASPP